VRAKIVATSPRICQAKPSSCSRQSFGRPSGALLSSPSRTSSAQSRQRRGDPSTARNTGVNGAGGTQDGDDGD
jgi:hypothetical protein